MAVGPGDDAAVVDPRTVVTVDMLVEGTHFDSRWTPAELGFKSIAASVADLAAMGARPSWAVLAVALPDPGVAADLGRGVGRACRRWGVSLVGGDTTRGTHTTVSVTMGGALVGSPLLRSGASVGDDLWVTGTLGGAGVGWSTKSPPAGAWRALTHPTPPLSFALGLAKRGLSACGMDLSDGLATDLPRLCAASGLGARVTSAALPLHPDVPAHRQSLAWAGGEDHELLFTAAPERADAVRWLAAAHGVRVQRIGTMTREAGCWLDDQVWPQDGFRHFAGAA